MTTRLKPILDHIVVRRDVGETKSTGGIVIPDSFAARPDQGTILAVGPGVRDADGNIRPLSVKAGDRILFSKGAGFDITVDKQELLVLKEINIFAIIKPQENA